MKQVVIGLIALLLIACGGGKKTVSPEQSPGPVRTTGGPQTTAPTQISADSLALMFAKQSAPRKEQTTSQETLTTAEQQLYHQQKPAATLPQFTFTTEPLEIFDLTTGIDLVFIIDGEGPADIKFSWNDPTGKMTSYKQKPKYDRRYTRNYNTDLVRKYIGPGEKELTAELVYDPGKEPIILTSRLKIVDGVTPAPAQPITIAPKEDSAPPAIAEVKSKPEIQPEPVRQTVAPVITMREPAKEEPSIEVAESKPVPVITPVTERIEIREEPAKESAITIDPLIIKSLAFDDIFFDYREWAAPSLTFNSNYFVTLGKIVKALKSDPHFIIRLIGHTDQSGSQEFNRVLAEQRAITVGKLIIDLFPVSDRETIARRIEIVPVGKTDPLIQGDNKIQEVLNRRVSIELGSTPARNKTLVEYLKPVAIQAAVPVAKPTVKATPTRPSTAGSVQQKLYENATKLFNTKQYDQAIAVFEEIVGLDPTDRLADNAQWWIGEAYFFQKQYSEALNAYKKVFELGDGNKSAYAQLRLGYCYLRLNQPQSAIAEFRKVSQNFPDAKEEIAKAQRNLKSLGAN